MITIDFFTTDRDYKYLWLKSVRGVDLSCHCARCLLGEYEQAFSGGVREVHNLKLKPAPAYYLCGVASDRVWSHNLHLAFTEEEGSVIEVDNDFCHVRILNARRLDISQRYIDKKDPNAGRREYRTCRNWQFASMFSQGILDDYRQKPNTDLKQLSIFDNGL